MATDDRRQYNSPAWPQVSSAKGGPDRSSYSFCTEPRPQSASTTAVGSVGRELIGKSSGMEAVLGQIKIVAPTQASVLLLGETGTGKELVARAIHQLSFRAGNPMVRVNCAAIPSELVESDLFGHEKGSFTGAIARKIGRIEMADGGTLFLDEIGDFPLELQAKLLRVLQEREFERVGSTQIRQVNIRLIAATSRNLPQMVADRQFRSDLYYRLNVFPIRIPPLRERVSDIPLLVWHFIEQYACELKRHIEVVSPEAMEAFRTYPWPGNIRELQNFIQRAVILSPGKVLRVPLVELQEPRSEGNNNLPDQARTVTLRELEREYILQTLKLTRWRIGGGGGAAALLGLNRTTLQSKMQRLGICRRLAAEMGNERVAVGGY